MLRRAVEFVLTVETAVGPVPQVAVGGSHNTGRHRRSPSINVDSDDTGEVAVGDNADVAELAAALAAAQDAARAAPQQPQDAAAPEAPAAAPAKRPFCAPGAWLPAQPTAHVVARGAARATRSRELEGPAAL